MKQLVACLIAAVCAATTVTAQSYSTVATMKHITGTDHYVVDAVISQLVDKDGGQVEKVISHPRVQTSAGVPASLYAGPSEKDAKYQSEDNVSMEVTWPKPGEGGMATCSLVVKRGDKITSKFKFQLQVEDN